VRPRTERKVRMIRTDMYVAYYVTGEREIKKQPRSCRAVFLSRKTYSISVTW